VDVTTPPARTLRVLIVDDEAAIRHVIARYLTRRGHQVAEAAEGAAALDLLAVGSYDVIISDRRMPGMGGEALLEVLRERGLSSRVIMLTGDPAGADQDADGGVTVLLKPIELQEIACAVEAVGGRAPGDDR
jgi:CheY-like chemotaxis protein